MKLIIILLILVIVVVLILALAVILRGGVRGYQKYSGLESQRSSAKQSRDLGADRLKNAERQLVQAQRALSSRHEYERAQDIELLRRRLSTLSDRLRHATYGYSPLGSKNPIREAELVDLQRRDADTIEDAQRILELSESVRHSVANQETIDLSILESSLESLSTSLDRRGATN